MYKNDITISVIVPVYNVEQYLEDCLESLIHQTEAFDEIILVNDGSTDGSGKICEDYAERFSHITLIRQENQGLSMARNAGMQCADSTYLMYVDADDAIDPDTVCILKQNLRKDPVEVLYFNAKCVNELGDLYCDEEQFVRDPKLTGYRMSGMQYFESSLAARLIVSACTAVYKKEFLVKNEIDFPKGLYYEDNVFYMDVVLHAETVKCLAESLYIRRWRENSIMTSSWNEKKCKDLIAVQMLMWESMFAYPKKEMYQELFRNFISARMLAAFGMILECNGSSELQEKKRLWMQKFVECWLPLYETEKLSWNDACLLREIFDYMDLGKTYEKLDQRAGHILHDLLNQKMERLPLQKTGVKVGIYGIGKHTEKLIESYRKSVGEILSELYFIVSVPGEQRDYLGRKVVFCGEIPKDTDCIVISSLIYQDEMIKQLQKYEIETQKIVTLYSRQDKRDLVVAEKYCI